MVGFLVEGEGRRRLVVGCWSPLLQCLACPVSGDHHGCQILNIALLDPSQRGMNYVSLSAFNIPSQPSRECPQRLDDFVCTFLMFSFLIYCVSYCDSDRRRLSRLELYRVDTYSRVVGRTREEVRASRLGRSSSEEYGRMVAARGRGRGRPLTTTDTRDSRDSARSHSQSHWAYFRSVSLSFSFSDSQIGESFGISD